MMKTPGALPMLEKSYFILIASDTYSGTGGIYPAYKLAEWRLDRGEWGIYPSTANRKVLKVDDEVLIYVGGQKRNRCCVIASARISKIESRRLLRAVDPPEVGIPNADMVLSFDSVKKIGPVDIRTKFDELSFIPPNRSKWGSALMGGCRRVTPQDFRILSEA